VDLGSQSGSHKNQDVFFHTDAGGIENKGSASYNVQTSNDTYHTDDETWSEEEEEEYEGGGEEEEEEEEEEEYEGDGQEDEDKEEVLARKIRSPQEFDDDVVELSSEETGNKEGDEGNGKGKGKGRGTGKGTGKGKSVSTDLLHSVYLDK
jgi:hypothetical protein